MTRHRRCSRGRRALATGLCVTVAGGAAWQLALGLPGTARAAETPLPVPHVTIDLPADPGGAPQGDVVLSPTINPDVTVDPRISVAPEGLDEVGLLGRSGGRGGGDGGATSVTCHHNSVVNLSHAFQDGVSVGEATTGAARDGNAGPGNLCGANTDNDGGSGKGEGKKHKKHEKNKSKKKNKNHDKTKSRPGPRSSDPGNPAALILPADPYREVK